MIDTPQLDPELEALANEADYDGPTMPSEDPVETAPAEPEAPEAPAAEKQAAPTPPAAAEPTYEITHNGRQIKATLSQVLKWGQQGYDYNQRMAEFKKQQEAVSAIEGKYKPIDEWVAANPDKWERLQAVIKAEQEGHGDLPAPVLQKLERFESIVNELQKERDAAKAKADDEALEREVQSFREKYKDLDWTSVDADGRTREQKVYAHAVEHGFKTFKSAFLDLYHDELVTFADTKARESLAKEKERNAKTGLLSKGAPAPKLSAPQQKTKNYDSTESILKELGL